jgi:hypothetical protein
MFLPRRIYEALPYGYICGGLALCGASYASSGAAWSDAVLAAGALGVVFGLVLILRRRSYRDEASRYDRQSLDK